MPLQVPAWYFWIGALEWKDTKFQKKNTNMFDVKIGVQAMIPASQLTGLHKTRKNEKSRNIEDE